MNSSSYIESAFQAISFLPGPFWLVLLVAPRHRLAMHIMDGFLFLLTLHFTLLTIPVVPQLLPVLASPTFAQVQAFIGSPMGTLGSWNHMVLADLWMGRWVAYDTLEGKHAFWVRLVFIPVILFFGPMGLCFYLVYRSVARRRFTLAPYR